VQTTPEDAPPGHIITIAAVRGRRSLLALAGAATLAGGLAAAPSPANAAVASCGATITQDTKLTGDVTGCKGHGIRIGADGITLDLKGHTVSPAAERNGKEHGILNKGHDGVTIRGGTRTAHRSDRLGRGHAGEPGIEHDRASLGRVPETMSAASSAGTANVSALEPDRRCRA
jgi:hypothetical protein